MSYVAGCRPVVSSKYTAGLNSPYKRSNKLLWSKIEGTSGRFLDFLDAEAFKVISLLFVCVSSRTTESLFALRIYAHCVYERANTVIQEGVVYRQRHTRERERERERERWSLEGERRALDIVRSDGKRGFRGQGVGRLHFWEAWNCDDYAVSPGRELFALECIAPLGGRNSPRGTIYRVSWWTWEAAMAACRAKASRRER